MSTERLLEARALLEEANTIAKAATELLAPKNITSAFADCCKSMTDAVRIIIEELEQRTRQDE